MRVVVTGARGMLGSVLLPCLKREHEVWGVDQEEFDIADGVAVARAFRDFRPDFALHLAAFTDVDGCEADPAKAERVNARGTQYVALACAETGAGLLYASTDYVFDGRGNQPYREEDVPNPLSVYGATKFWGERLVQALVPRHIIVRSSWLFGPGGKNFVSTILKAASVSSELRVVSDQRGSPTYTRHLARTLVEILVAGEQGVFHVTGAGDCSWFEFARAIVEVGGYPQVSVVPITTPEAKRLAPRPAFSAMANRHLAACGLAALRPWREGLAQYIAEDWSIRPG